MTALALDPHYRRRESWWVHGLYEDTDGYYRYNGEMDADTFLAAACGIGRNHGPALLFDLFHQGCIDIAKYPAVVADVWSSAEFPASAMEPGIWIDLFGEAGYTDDGQPARRPTGPVEVYRGCHDDRRFGMSWSADRTRAQWFADRDLGGGKGNVHVHLASPEELLARIGVECGRGEAEYVIDPSFLHDDDARVL